MIATCQFCRQMIKGPDSASLDPKARGAYEYRQLSMLVSAHMSETHTEVATEIMTMMAVAGAAVAMRFVEGSDAAVDSWRTDMCDVLREAFNPAPRSPQLSVEGQAATEASASGS